MKPFVIALNGPPGIGKSWLAVQIATILPCSSAIMSFAEPLRREILELHQWPLSRYGEFKTHVFNDGRTGRDCLIQHGNGMRAKDIHHWSRQLTDHPEFSARQVIIVDDTGFYDEQDWLEQHADRLMTIVMAPIEISVGSIFPGDSRRCLPPRGGFRTTDSSKALEIFKRWLNHAGQGDSDQSFITRTFDLERLMAT